MPGFEGEFGLDDSSLGAMLELRWQRTVNSVLTVCLSPGDNLMPGRRFDHVHSPKGPRGCNVSTPAGHLSAMRQLIIAALMGAFAITAFAADVTGKWMGQVEGRRGPQELTFNLTQSGNSLTGTVTTPAGEQPIMDGKVEGDNISFVVTIEARGNTFKQEYKGTISGNEIRFTRSGGRGNPVEFTAKKQ
jgi:hypothetical protein